MSLHKVEITGVQARERDALQCDRVGGIEADHRIRTYLRRVFLHSSEISELRTTQLYTVEGWVEVCDCVLTKTALERKYIRTFFRVY